MTHTLYCLTSPSGKKYYGISKHFNVRMNEHKDSSRKGNHALARAIRKYGWDSFKKERICEGVLDVIKQLEISAISVGSSFIPLGYNLTRGGEGTSGYTHSKEECARRSVWAKEHCSSHMKRLGASHRGKIVSEITKTKQSKAAKARSDGYVKAKVLSLHSEESVAKKKIWWASDKLRELGITRGKILGNLPNPTVGRVWVNKDSKNKRILPEQVEYYLCAGWARGQFRINTSR